MSNLDPEVLYLILSKVAAKETVYSYDPSRVPAGQPPGTITHQELGAVYERVTGNRVGARLNWSVPLNQLNQLLLQCGLPSLAAVVVSDASAAPAPELSDALKQVHAKKWPPFSALKELYRKRKK